MSLKSSHHSPNTPERDRSFRPKLSDALRRVSFSPKRPRSSPSRQSHSASHLREQPTTPHQPNQTSPLSPFRPTHSQVDATAAKPRLRRGNDRHTVSFQQDLSSSRPLPITNDPHGYNGRDIEIQGGRTDASLKPHSLTRHATRSSKRSIRNPFTDIVNQNNFHSGVDSSHRHIPGRRHLASKIDGRVQLPDVTGLTSAIESPAKTALQHSQFPGNDGFRESDGERSRFFHDYSNS